MGIIISEAHSVLKPSNKIKVNNFRGMRYIDNIPIPHAFNGSHAYNLTPKTGLLVITNLSTEYFFSEMTIYDLFKIIRATRNTKWKGSYIREVITCRYCGGSGKSDWISNITKLPVTYDPSNRLSYRRASNVYYKCNDTGYYLTRAYLRKPVETICKKCAGTGLHFVNQKNLTKADLHNV